MAAAAAAATAVVVVVVVVVVDDGVVVAAATAAAASVASVAAGDTGSGRVRLIVTGDAIGKTGTGQETYFTSTACTATTLIRSWVTRSAT